MLQYLMSLQNNRQSRGEQQQGKVVYFRRKNKHSYAVKIGKSVDLDRVVRMIAQKQNISSNDLLLFDKGKALPISDNCTHLQHGQIVHVIDVNQVHISTLTITIRTLQNQTSTHTVLSASSIRNFIRDKLSNISTLPYFYIALVHMGKVMHPQRTFEEEMVENGAQVVMVNVQEYAKKKKAQNVGDIVSSGRQASEFSKQKGTIRLQESANTDEIKEEVLHSQNVEKKSSTPQLETTEKKEQSNQHIQENDELPPQMPTDKLKFQIKVSQVDSVDSNQQDHNKVQFQSSDSNQLISCDPDLSKQALEQPSSPTKKIKQKVNSRQIRPGQFLISSAAFRSKTAGFLANLLTEYKFMFEQQKQ